MQCTIFTSYIEMERYWKFLRQGEMIHEIQIYTLSASTTPSFTCTCIYSGVCVFVHPQIKTRRLQTLLKRGPKAAQTRRFLKANENRVSTRLTTLKTLRMRMQTFANLH